MRKAVSGIMTSIDRNGTKINWIFSGMIRFNNLYNGPSTAAINSGGKTCEL